MKRVKIMLFVIITFAIVGGALAFKAKRYGQVIYTTTNPIVGANCWYPWPNHTVATISNIPKISLAREKGGPCILTYTTVEP